MKFKLSLFLSIIITTIICSYRFPYDYKADHFAVKFHYVNYVGKTFGEFYRDFKMQADKKKIATNCNLYVPNVFSIKGAKIFVAHDYSVIAYFRGKHHLFSPDFSDKKDTTSRQFSCLCATYDTIRIDSFELIKKGISLKKTVK